MSNVKFSQLPNLGNITAATIVPVVASGVNYTVTAANLQTYVNGGAGNISSNNISATGTITATGNITGGNINTGGQVVATGNITAPYFFGNGSQLTGIVSSYGNANVAAYLPTYTGNLAGGNLSVTSNIAGGNITLSGSIGGSGSRLTNLPAANIVGTVATATSATTAGTVTTAAQANITSVGSLTSLAVSGNITGGNISSTGLISTTGNLTGQLMNYKELVYNLPGSLISGAYTPDWANGPVQTILFSNTQTVFTLNAPTNMVTGSSITLILTQPATGNVSTLSANATYKFAGAYKTLSTTNSAIDVISIFYDGTNYLCNLVKGYAA